MPANESDDGYLSRYCYRFLGISFVKLIENKSLIFFIATGSLISLLWLGGEPLVTLLNYNRDAIASGEFWRIITGHFVHSNGWHLLLNLASLTMIGLLFSQHLSALLWLISFLLSGMIVSASYFWLAPQFSYYVGLSAILYGVIIVGALLDIKEQPTIAWIILIVVTARVIWQQFSGSVESLAELIEDRVAIESHLFGICSGYAIGLLLLARQGFSPQKQKQMHNHKQ